MLTNRQRLVAGVVAGAFGACLAFLLSRVLRLDADPVSAVAGLVRDLTPGNIALTLIHLVGTWDKPLLLLGTTLGLLSILGWVGKNWPEPKSKAILVGLALLGGLALWRIPQADFRYLLPLAAGVLGWVFGLRLLLAEKEVAAGAAAAVAPRRVFLKSALVLTGVTAFSGVAGIALTKTRAQITKVQQAVKQKFSVGEVPENAQILSQPWRTPNQDFYLIDTALVKPEIDPDTWELRIHGLVEKELRLSYADLLARKQTAAWVTLCCVSNQVGGELVGNAYWSGVLVRELLAEAGVKPGADAVKQTSADGWNCGTPLSALTDQRDALLALSMNGEALPVAHGFPARLVVPGLYGFVSATKWVVDLEVTKFADFTAYWTERGWSATGPVKTQSRIDVPRVGQVVTGEQVTIGGVAWAQHTGISQVEVQVDGQPWVSAELGGVGSTDTWVQWRLKVPLAAGEHFVKVRATDKSGYTQTAAIHDVVPDGATGHHQISFLVA